MTNAQLRWLCVALAPDFRAAWEHNEKHGRIFAASCTLRGKPHELSMCASGNDASDERMVLQSCYEQLNKEE